MLSLGDAVAGLDGLLGKHPTAAALGVLLPAAGLCAPAEPSLATPKPACHYTAL